MYRLEKLIDKLIENNALHREGFRCAGFRLNDMPTDKILDQLEKEIKELRDAIKNEPQENILNEFSDVTSIMLHLKKRLEFENKKIEDAAIKKLYGRFIDGLPGIKEVLNPCLTEPLTLEQLRDTKNKNYLVTEYVSIHINEITDRAFENFLDHISMLITNTELLEDISYKVVDVLEDNELLMEVMGSCEMIVKMQENEEIYIKLKDIELPDGHVIESPDEDGTIRIRDINGNLDASIQREDEKYKDYIKYFPDYIYVDREDEEYHCENCGSDDVSKDGNSLSCNEKECGWTKSEYFK